VGLIAGLDVVVKRKNTYPCQESNSGHPVHSIFTMLIELSWLLTEEVIGIRKLKVK
jgi:hypothetical protein